MTLDIQGLKDRIQERYLSREKEFANDLTCNKGWALLYSSKNTINRSEKNTIFLGLNPGGGHENDKKDFRDNFSYEGEYGSQYCELWEAEEPGKAPLQEQVKHLCKILEVGITKILSGNLVPFRSRGEGGITGDDIEFGGNIWEEIIGDRTFRLVTMGRKCETKIVELFNAEKLESIATGWGNTEARFYKCDQGEICCLPHLSWNKIFDRGKTDKLEKRIKKMPIH